MDKKVLVVDDEASVLVMLEERLKYAGYDVITAQDGREAIRIAKRENPDLILLDIMMPEMDGTEAAKILEKDPETKNIPIIFLTCLVKKEEEANKSVIGGHYFIAKPYTSEALLEAVEKHIR